MMATLQADERAEFITLLNYIVSSLNRKSKTTPGYVAKHWYVVEQVR
jgi:hypothetical protein